MAARFPMAVVVTGSPLTVTVEGASAVVAAEDFVGGLTTDDRVQAAFLGDRLTVQQLAGGPPQSTTATPNTLALRDANARIKAADGVADDDVVTVGQMPATDTGWVDLTPAIGSGTLRYRAEGGWVTVEIDITATISTGAVNLSSSGAIPTALRPGTNARGAVYMGALTDSTAYVTTSGTVGVINSTGSSKASVSGPVVWHVA